MMNYHQQSTEVWFKQSLAGSLHPVNRHNWGRSEVTNLYEGRDRDHYVPGNGPARRPGQTPNQTHAGRLGHHVPWASGTQAPPAAQDALATVRSSELCSWCGRPAGGASSGPHSAHPAPSQLLNGGPQWRPGASWCGGCIALVFVSFLLLMKSKFELALDKEGN